MFSDLVPRTPLPFIVRNICDDILQKAITDLPNAYVKFMNQQCLSETFKMATPFPKESLDCTGHPRLMLMYQTFYRKLVNGNEINLERRMEECKKWKQLNFARDRFWGCPAGEFVLANQKAVETIRMTKFPVFPKLQISF